VIINQNTRDSGPYFYACDYCGCDERSLSGDSLSDWAWVMQSSIGPDGYSFDICASCQRALPKCLRDMSTVGGFVGTRGDDDT
jgi:hypothetical protein